MQTLLTGWHFMRWFRLAISIFIGVQAIQNHDAFSGMFAAFFLYQALTNTGCCGANGCAVPTAKNNTSNTEDVSFEEVKTQQINN
jgi:hypothetical protein